MKTKFKHRKLAVIACGLCGLFYTSLALLYAFHNYWLVAVIFGLFAFFGYGVTYFVASITQQQSKEEKV